MKVILLILLFTSSAMAQFTAPVPVVDSGFFLTRKEVVTAVNKIRILQEEKKINDALIPLYRSQVAEFRSLSDEKNNIIRAQAGELAFYQKNEQLYKKEIENMKPGLLDNFWLHIAIGAIAGILIYKYILK